MRPINHFDCIVIGGGAAGFFGAINCAASNVSLKIAILERGNEVLNKVRISGGGRCNVTHACFDPDELTQYYPRGQKELRGPFHAFNCLDTVNWFESHGVKLKAEADGRMFPVTDDSETIVRCLMDNALRSGIKIYTSIRVDSFQKKTSHFHVKTNKGDFQCSRLLVATGSAKSVWETLKNLGHTIIDPVPSLFTFNIQDIRLQDLQGIAVELAEVSVVTGGNKDLQPVTGPVLITHWGLSGPGVLKLSAWGARMFHDLNYRFEISINWLYPSEGEEILEKMLLLKSGRWAGKKTDTQSPFPEIPLRLWKQLSNWALKQESKKNWADLTKAEIQHLANTLTQCVFKVNGKSTFKEEFVTAGGVSLKEINLKNFESKIIPGLFIAGEALDIDAVTGGFNFQAAWTGGFLAGCEMGSQSVG